MLYEELLEFCRPRFTEFFRNVPIFENQFTWGPFQQKCYDCMYVQNSYGKLSAVQNLQEKIPELRDICRKCGAFFIPARNKSIPKYDLVLGQQHEEVLMAFLEKKLGAKTVRADLQNRSYPDCKILRADGTAAAYFEVKFHGAPFVSALRLTGRYCYEGSATLDHQKIEKQLALLDSEIDAPVFYVHWIEYPCLKGVFFETSEQVREYMHSCHEVFERQRRAGDDQKSSQAVYLKKLYSPLLFMRSFEEFVEELQGLLQS